MRPLRQFGFILVVAGLGGVSDASAQSSLGAATGCVAVAALSDSPSLCIHDRAGLFQFDTVAKAREGLRQYRREYHRDLFLETFAHPPTTDQSLVRRLIRQHQDKYFTNWARQRADAIGVDGVYVLICKEPKHVIVLVHPNTPEQAFSGDKAKELRKRLERQLAKSPDTAPGLALAFVRDTVNESLSTPVSEANSIRFETVLAILAGIGGVWLLLSLVRAILMRRDIVKHDRASVGLLAGFCAALFGTTAGHWIYDHVFHAHGPATPAPESEYLGH